jgi:uncharacterized membrane protein YidH (DUF202 family)
MTRESHNSVDPRVTLAGDRTRMAQFRTQLALDRTTLAWVRTTLTMASFGFGMVAFFRSIRQTNPTAEAIRFHEGAIFFGLSLIVLGIAATIAAGLSHWLTLRKIKRGQVPAVSLWSLSIATAVLLVVAGIVGLWAISEH